MFSPVREQKKLLRAKVRSEAHAGGVEGASRKLADTFLRNIRLDDGAVVASYSAIRNEIDMTELNDALREKGHKIALPVIVGKGKPLIFRAYEKGDTLLANPLGIFEPASFALSANPDVLLIPLLAFDRMRNRLGYGGGYYDRTIKKLRAQKPLLTLGIAYACQEVAQVPVGPNDVPLDRIITEFGIF
ncbi:MAG: 5-formyltetrahydrofolate cyclo-ligase [Bdellovibrionales bacterium]